jgi:hypothetical protein
VENFDGNNLRRPEGFVSLTRVSLGVDQNTINLLPLAMRRNFVTMPGSSRTRGARVNRTPITSVRRSPMPVGQAENTPA